MGLQGFQAFQTVIEEVVERLIRAVTDASWVDAGDWRKLFNGPFSLNGH
jgi:hypothetical protein